MVFVDESREEDTHATITLNTVKQNSYNRDN